MPVRIPRRSSASGSGGRTRNPYSPFSGSGGSSSRSYSGTLEERLAERREDVDGGGGKAADPNKTISDNITRMLNSPDPKVKEQGIKIAQMYGGGGNALVASGAILSDVLKQEDAEQTPLGQVFDKAAPVFDLLARGGNAAQEYIQAGMETTGLDDKAFDLLNPEATKLNDPGNLSPAAKNIIGDAAGSGGYKDVGRALWGTRRWDPTSQRYKEDTLTFAGALGQDPNQLGSDALSRVVNAADFTGTAAIDPLNLIGGGGSKVVAKGVAATAGVKLAEEGAQALTPALVRQIERQGFKAADAVADPVIMSEALKRVGLRKGTTSAQRKTLRDALISEAEATRTTRGILGPSRAVPLRGDGLRNPLTLLARTATGKGRRTGAERAAETRLVQALNYDRGGLRFANRSLPEAVKGPVRRGIAGDTRYLGTFGAEASVLGERDELATRLLGKSENAAMRAEGERAAGDLMAGIAPEEAAARYTQSRRAATTSENTAAKADSLSGLNAEEALALEPSLGRVTVPLVERKPGLAQALGGDTLARWFRTGAGVRQARALAPGADEAVLQAERTGRAVGNANARNFGSDLAASAKKAGHLDAEQQAIIRDALDMGGDVETVAASLPYELGEHLHKLNDLRQVIYDTIIKYDLAPVKNLRDAEEYMPIIFTKEGRKALEQARMYGGERYGKLLGRDLGRSLTEGGHLLKREAFKDMTVSEANAELVQNFIEDGYLKAGQDALVLDPAELIATRFNQVNADVVKITALQDMEKALTGPLGEKLVKRFPPEKGRSKKVNAEIKAMEKRGFRKVTLGPAGDVMVHPDLAEPVDSYFKIITGDPDITQFGKLVDGWNRLWRAYATVPLIGGTGFTTKNVIGNIFNNTLAGVGISAYTEAMGMQLAVRKAKRLHPDMQIPEALDAIGADQRLSSMVAAALEEGVIDESFYRVDVGGNSATNALTATRTTAGKAAALADVRNPSQMLGVRSGRAVNSAMEDNARLAHFIHKMDELGSIPEAAASVRRYLFDYSDLTPFEQKVMKRANAFYTFSRKNVPLQFAELVRNPAGQRRLLMAEQQLTGATGAEDDGSELPAWAGEIGLRMGDTQGRAITGNSNPFVGGIETPLESATKTLDPLRSLLPGSGRSAQDTAQGIVGLTSGGPVSLAKTVMDEASGSSSFSGGSLLNPEGERKTPLAISLAGSVLPVISKNYSALGLRKDPESGRVRLAKFLTGISGKEITPDMSESERRRRSLEVADIVKSLGEEGRDIPTISELRAVDWIPDKETYEEAVLQNALASGDGQRIRLALYQLLGVNPEDVAGSGATESKAPR